MTRRLFAISILSLAFLALGPGVALACGGLVADEHAEVLRKATTLAAWHNGYEHYVTGFQFAGSASSFGYIIPLPGVPSKIQKGGEWTLERLELEVSPVLAALDARAAAVPGPVTVIQQVRVDALDITVVRGGGPDVAAWAEKHGFDLTPDTGAVLGRYSSAGAIFALAKYDNEDAVRRGLAEGQGTVIHFTIRLPAGPWIPLRILALGKGGPEIVNADLFVLTDHAPSLTPEFFDMPGASVRAYRPATPSLLEELRADRGMGWMPRDGMWLTALSMETPAALITTDLSIDGGGPPAPPSIPLPALPAVWPWALGGIGAALLTFVVVLALPKRPQPQPA